MYEKHKEKPISHRHFRVRFLKHFLFAALILCFSLVVGTVGHVYFEAMDWQKAFLSSCILLSGQGLAVFPETELGQLFASIYALYAGLVFLVTSGIIIAPVFHRFLHHFNWLEDE